MFSRSGSNSAEQYDRTDTEVRIKQNIQIKTVNSHNLDTDGQIYSQFQHEIEQDKGNDQTSEHQTADLQTAVYCTVN